jgi:hypothetical protein
MAVYIKCMDLYQNVPMWYGAQAKRQLLPLYVYKNDNVNKLFLGVGYGGFHSTNVSCRGLLGCDTTFNTTWHHKPEHLNLKLFLDCII